MREPAARIARSLPLQAALLGVVCALVFWTNLSARDFHKTEGHRALPGFAIVETGEWMPTRLFGAAYVRKPPGMPWAVALSATALGPSEFAARAVSALSMTLAAFAALLFAHRWFGPPWGLAAGLAQTLLPRLWSSGRRAEIEPALYLFTLVASLLVIHVLLVQGRRSGARALATALALGACLAGMMVFKGPVYLPVVAAAALGCAWAAARPALLLNPILLGGIAAAGAILAPLLLGFRHALEGEPFVVRESVSDFLWNADSVAGPLLFPVRTLATLFPASLALLLPWGPDARREAAADPRPLAPLIAKSAAIGCVFALVVYAALGVANPRYGMGAAAFLPVLVAAAARGAFEQGAYLSHRARIALILFLGRPWAWPAVLLTAWGVFVSVIEPGTARTTGRPAGEALGRAAPGHTVIWAGGVINAKPEILYYARREAALLGHTVEPLWRPEDLAAASLPASGGVLLLLTDAELDRYRRAHPDAFFYPMHEGEADRLRFVLVEPR